MVGLNWVFCYWCNRDCLGLSTVNIIILLGVNLLANNMIITSFMSIISMNTTISCYITIIFTCKQTWVYIKSIHINRTRAFMLYSWICKFDFEVLNMKIYFPLHVELHFCGRPYKGCIYFNQIWSYNITIGVLILLLWDFIPWRE